MERPHWISLSLALAVAGCAGEKSPTSSAEAPALPSVSKTSAGRHPGDAQPILPTVAPDDAPKPLPAAASGTEVASAPSPAPDSAPVATAEVKVPPAGAKPPAVIPEPAPLEPREMKLLIPEKTFQKEGAEGALRVSFDDIDLLKVLNAEPVPADVADHLPPWMKALDGKTIRLRGWMFPPPLETDLPAFLFVRDNQICCFGRKPKVYDKLGVKMKAGSTAHYIQGRPFDVVGRFVIKPRVSPAGELDFLYLIEDAAVIDNG